MIELVKFQRVKMRGFSRLGSTQLVKAKSFQWVSFTGVLSLSALIAQWLVLLALADIQLEMLAREAFPL